MTIPLFCLFLMMLFTIFNKTPLVFAQAKEGRKQGAGYDNHDPRSQQKRLEGRGARALAAHQNGFEAFGFFTAGVLVSHVAGNAPTLSAVLAIGFVVSRLVYTWLYLNNQPTARSLVWGLAYGCCLGLMLTPAF